MKIENITKKKNYLKNKYDIDEDISDAESISMLNDIQIH